MSATGGEATWTAAQPIDLSACGSRFVIGVKDYERGGTYSQNTLTLSLFDDIGNDGHATAIINAASPPGPYTLEIALADYTGVDLTHITQVVLEIVHSGDGWTKIDFLRLSA